LGGRVVFLDVGAGDADPVSHSYVCPRKLKLKKINVSSAGAGPAPSTTRSRQPQALTHRRNQNRAVPAAGARKRGKPHSESARSARNTTPTVPHRQWPSARRARISRAGDRGSAVHVRGGRPRPRTPIQAALTAAKHASLEGLRRHRRARQIENRPAAAARPRHRADRAGGVAERPSRISSARKPDGCNTRRF